MSLSSLYFAHVDESPSVILKGIKIQSETVQWLFLSQDYSKFTKWQNNLPSNFSPIDFKQKLEEGIRTLSEPFSEKITDLGEVYDSPAWWASRVSEKNNLVSSLFLYCCYFFVWDSLMKELHGQVVVLVEDDDLLQLIQQSALESGCSIKRKYQGNVFLKCFYRFYKSLGRIVKFFLRSGLLYMAGGPRIPKSYQEGAILIHTYVDEACFKKDGKFQDRYFLELSEWLNNKGYKTITLPVLFNIQRSYRNAWKYLMKADRCFINPFQYYTFVDYLFVIKESFRQQLFDFHLIKLNGLDVTSLFISEKEKKAFENLETLLYYRLPLRLYNHGYRLARVIMPFENMIDEKIFNLGLKKYSKETISLGYQHGALWPNLMSQFISSREAVFAPLPDKIVCNGDLFLNILVKKGLPKEKLFLGPALRYSYLFNNSFNKKQDRLIKTILVTLPLMKSDAEELLIKVLRALREKSDLNILIKPHPMTEDGWFTWLISQMKLPPHFLIVHGSMLEQLTKAAIVIGMSSGTLMEVYATSKALIIVGRSTSIDFNPLGFLSGFDKIDVTPEEIANRVEEILIELDQSNINLENNLNVFSPITDELMEAFLK